MVHQSDVVLGFEVTEQVRYDHRVVTSPELAVNALPGKSAIGMPAARVLSGHLQYARKVLRDDFALRCEARNGDT